MKQIFLKVLLAIPLVLIADVVSAQSIITSGAGGCDFATGDIKASCIPTFIAHVIQQVFKYTGAICLIFIMIGGFQYALGNLVGGKDKAMATIKWAVLGMIISAFSFFILDFILTALGA